MTPSVEALAERLVSGMYEVAREWNEDDHPRDEGGKFTAGGGGEAPSAGQDGSGEKVAGPHANHPDARPLTTIGTGRLHPKDVEDYVRASGEPHRAAPLPEGISRGKVGQCYRNATMAMLEDETLDYAEGLAYPNSSPLAVLHGWAVTKDGRVVDPTFPNPERARYFGVRYDRNKYIAHITKTKYFGVLGSSDKAAAKAIKNGGI